MASTTQVKIGEFIEKALQSEIMICVFFMMGKMEEYGTEFL